MDLTPIQVSKRTRDIFKAEAHRRSKPGKDVTMRDILEQYAEKINRKHGFVGEVK